MKIQMCNQNRFFFSWQKRKKRVVCVAIICSVLFCCYYYLSFKPRCLFPLVVFRAFSKLESRDLRDVTVITAFLDLGPFRKGGDFKKNSYKVYTPQKYLEWAEAYRYLANPLVVYTDSPHFEKWFLDARKGMRHKTSVIRIDKDDIPSFQRIQRVARVFSDPEYPKFHPNTVLPDYACSQHAKVDLVDSAIRNNQFQTRYFAWIDIGYFRFTTFRKRKFWIVVPPRMNDSKVALTEITSPDFSLHPETIFRTNQVWVGGGMVLAKAGAYKKYIEEYQKATEYFLDRGIFNTDQQVIYSMFTHIGRKTLNITTELQTFTWSLGNSSPQCWFYLGYLCYKEE